MTGQYITAWALMIVTVVNLLVDSHYHRLLGRLLTAATMLLATALVAMRPT
jgi:hypothetical protein